MSSLSGRRRWPRSSTPGLASSRSSASSPAITCTRWRKTSRAPVKAFLLDQRRVAGVGNIYADEALFRARVHPLRPANKLTRAQCAAIRDAVVESLMAGLAAKGATIDDFRDPYGVSGSFQDQFLVHLREHEPCPNCGNPVRKLRAAGRGTYVCERCQPRPRVRRKVACARQSCRPAWVERSRRGCRNPPHRG